MALQISTKYRQLLSAILLLLYLFIAMPVQYWHHCKNHPNQQANQKQSGSYISLVKSTGISHECKICSHQYTIYHSEITTIQVICIRPYINPIASPETFYIHQPLSGLSNKSPPAIA
ncbi:MAG: hypothetical protein ABJA37_11185 [Ferruginibacter sp.]